MMKRYTARSRERTEINAVVECVESVAVGKCLVRESRFHWRIRDGHVSRHRH